MNIIDVNITSNLLNYRNFITIIFLYDVIPVKRFTNKGILLPTHLITKTLVYIYIYIYIYIYSV